MLVLSGCGTSPVDASNTGFGSSLSGTSSSHQGLSRIFGHNYGWGIVVFTIIVRIIILPLMIYQMKSMQTTEIQPQLMALQKKYPDRSDPEQMHDERRTKAPLCGSGSKSRCRMFAPLGSNADSDCFVSSNFPFRNIEDGQIFVDAAGG